ncbi:EPIDERMAL PATTERNING FACTOR-like protein 5 [Ziziphus jujuba]|uniref:Epidermal patterning factor-like protein n=1 Tax=Ziziphus jujuba TaxID=326968 RepID=A0ABM3IRA1_ZIZJJ|nr:EPIDERMAL PATTERNING FACTOR-like protein 5 [Ziziphus jujuba]
MGVLHQRHHCSSHYVRLSTLTAFFTFLCLFVSTSTSSALTLTQLGGLESKESGEVALERVLSQKRLTGPGSSPPTCRSKCGRCSPCKPVHVPIQPGLSFPLEYYPEAWRCKCGNKLFMP